jgi:hypothetical protein
MFFAKTYAAVCGLATLSSAHMIMANPKPFAGVSQSPLLETGTNFPCQMPDYGSTSASPMAKGTPQELSFIGQAVHGGGSCQVSITYDTAPTKDSVWKVIHSIQGGCPAKNQEGNMGNSATTADPFVYGFTIPDDIPTGNATLAWTWLNRVGNREYYMNCAPISITGGDGDKSNYEALPDMLVANIAALTTCTTTGLEPNEFLYPNPGKTVENFNMKELVSLKGDCGPVAAGGGSGSSDPTTVASTAVVAPSATSIPGGVFITVKPSSVASSAAAAPTTAEAPSTTAEEAPATTATEAPATIATVVATTPTAAAPAATATSSSGSTGSSGSSSGATTAGSACSPEGVWNCVGGSSFQRCGSGTWSPVMALAAGMSCTPGQGASLDMWATNGKMRRRLTRFNAY